MKITYLLKSRLNIFYRDYCDHFNKSIKYSSMGSDYTLGIKIPFTKKAIFFQWIK
jgi:hypothetical protein